MINLKNVQDLKILAYDEIDRPILQFDGPGGIIGGSAKRTLTNIEIGGFEIRVQ